VSGQRAVDDSDKRVRRFSNLETETGRIAEIEIQAAARDHNRVGLCWTCCEQEQAQRYRDGDTEHDTLRRPPQAK
jgi:hypothetical protein